jgi:hypothetical protein
VQLSGENDYDWHPKDTTRSTNSLHKWAKELVDLDAAKPFKMIANPLTLVVDTKNAKIEDVSFVPIGVQMNPRGVREGGAAKRLLDYHLNR